MKNWFDKSSTELELENADLRKRLDAMQAELIRLSTENENLRRARPVSHSVAIDCDGRFTK